MEKLTISKRIWSVFLTLAMVLTMSVTALPSYAADGGTISLKYNPDVELKEPTEFKLYRVGTYGSDANDKVVINLTQEFAASGINLNIPVPEKEEDKAEGKAWHNAWLKAASDLENYVKTPGEGKTIPDPVWTGSLSKSDQFQSLKDENGNVQFFDRGVYLLVGDEQEIPELQQFWAPVPVLIDVLNGERQFTIENTEIKMQHRPVVYEHVLFKDWQDEGHKEARPKKLEVGIYYGSTQVDTVTLNDGNNWTYTWYSHEAPSEERIYKNDKVTTDKLNKQNGYSIPLPEEAGVWRVEELQTPEYKDATKYYARSFDHQAYQKVTTSSDAESGDSGETAAPAEGSDEQSPETAKNPADYAERFTITNKFSPADLTIRKNLKSYLDQQDANATVVFEIVGKINGIDKPVYQNSVGMTFKGPGIQELTLSNIPYNLDSLTVTEVYSTNYNVQGDAARILEANTDQQSGKRTYSVEFVNEYKPGPPTYSTGIVNIYGSDGKYTPKDDTSADFTPKPAEQTEPTPVEP